MCTQCWVQQPKRRDASRPFKTMPPLRVQEKKPFETLTAADNSYSQPAIDLSQNETPEEKNHFDRVEQESKEKQMRSPWMRQGSDEPPVKKKRSAGAMTKGKLLTTPSRMLKLILPLTTRDTNNERKDIEPLALLVHPQQPLSYLERLIQSELPPLEVDGKERIPTVTFRAQDSSDEDVMSGTPAPEELEKEDEIENPDEMNIGGKTARTGKISSPSSDSKSDVKEKEDSVARRREKNQPADHRHPEFVRWSPSTEIGDFIRDAARAKEFAVDIEGASEAIYIGVPSFDDRTYYLRMRLRKTSRQILKFADIKSECDKIAQRGAQRVAQGGFVGLIGWWGMVYYLTFKTDLGWDVMEPSALYEQKGFNLRLWEGLVEEANRLRREIKMVADEYDVEWDEIKDEQDERVAEALREERKKKNGKDKKEGKDDDDKDDDD
ncbi:hypothetical protein BDY17DRAFT_258811 [Neohortaea acidophila]|uniref:Calcium uniporter protein n=1 Tax=Neohortaea acidophila TaxID=245834 RepID=A0A6A6PFK4_9PEZI|nr:uncharacterized protein BDY17DRAFT_258811 [Neohortaea acidophila]KAF2478536.1 hypothetical protein BDY17DRAFT_258811 [Neohortaea acidophila]